jgi:hypothetical protein
MPSYLTNNELVQRLVARSVHVSSKQKTRPHLLELCLANGLVTRDESMTTRNAAASRTAILTAALGDLGCELRGDSRLCDAYIQDGEGDAYDIAATMREMRFYFDHTTYAQELDDLHEQAEQEYEDDCRYGHDGDDRDMRPRFRDYYDPHEASEAAKTTALAAWVRAKPDLQAALDDDALPASLRQHLASTEVRSRFDRWAERAVGLHGEGMRRFGSTPAGRMCSERLRGSIDLRTCATPEHFEALFGNALRLFVQVRQCRKHASDVARRWLGLSLFDSSSASDLRTRVDALASDAAPQRLSLEAIQVGLGDAVRDVQARVHAEQVRQCRTHASVVARGWLGPSLFDSSSASDLRTRVDALASEAAPQRLSLEATQAGLGDAFADALAASGFVRGATTFSNVRSDLRFTAQPRVWFCTTGCCRYKGGVPGILDHSRARHGIDDPFKVNALSTTGASIPIH